MKQIKKKLKSCAGESLAETLIAVLVIVLALTMLAGMITATTNIVTRSKDKMNDYYEENARLEKMSGDKKNLTLSITGTEDEKIEVTVMAFVNEEFGNTPVIAYGLG